MKRAVKGLISLLAAAALFAALSPPSPVEGRSAGQEKVDYERDIKPIFAAACYSCHSRQRGFGQLRLDTKKDAMKGGVTGPVIIPGKGAESLLVKRIRGEGGDGQMPLGKDPLKPEQIELISRWIDEGAVWPDDEKTSSTEAQKHWAYVKPVRPAPPAVKNPAWIRNPIDNFILARLEKEGLTPSPEAERSKLLRRVSLDLIGLPPSPEELDAFLADTSPDAYEKAVDRLLASPHYGERWARMWLDLARYADSNGYEKDQPRVMWKYRDWVINAFNRDLPFDQFTIEQIAGDMLPHPSTEQMIATGFHRNTMLNQEGGIDPHEARYETIIDRVNTTATVWLGTTLGCAQCHNHKYDPFSQKDYFRFYAFFEGAEYHIQGEDSSRFVKEPELALPTPEQDAKRKLLDAELQRLNATLRTQTPELERAQAEWEKDLRAGAKNWITLEPLSMVSTGGARLTRQADDSILVSGDNPELETYIITARTSARALTGLRLEALPDPSLPQGGPGRDPYGNFLLTGLEVEAAPADRPSAVTKLTLSDARVDDSAYRFDARRFFQSEPQSSAVDAPRGWYVNATRDEKRIPRQAIFVFGSGKGSDEGTRAATASMASSTGNSSAGTILKISLKFEGGSLGQAIGRFRLSVTADEDPMQLASIPARLRAAIEGPPEKRSEKEREEIAALFRSLTPLLAEERKRAAKLREELSNLGIVTALVMREQKLTEAPWTYLRERGSFLSPGERLTAGVPAVLHPLPQGVTPNRLALARWLVDENNPLVARVLVNRLWEQIFGRGIVETSEDFGSQGAPPSHPELLDYLATELIAGKWSMKRLLRTIVTSATYRQRSEASRELVERDPYNRLYARGPRFRMEAEMVRDTALAASGLLSRKIGGPSVYPPQPEGIWRNPYSNARWMTSEGEDRYRRSIYTFIRRTSPYPSLITFDATSREYCTVRRVRTNTPLQALTTLNDDAYFEMARALGQRAMSGGGAQLRERLAYAFRLCVAREPKAEELDRLTRYYAEQHRIFTRSRSDAIKVAGKQSGSGARRPVAEIAAWTMVANALLNLDETLTKE